MENWETLEASRVNDKLIETRMKEVKDKDGIVSERVVEKWVEKVPMQLQERVVEKIAPVVLNRVVESYDGDVLVGRRVEGVQDTKVSAVSQDNAFQGKVDAIEEKINVLYKAIMSDKADKVDTAKCTFVDQGECCGSPLNCTKSVCPRGFNKANLVGLTSMQSRVDASDKKSFLLTAALWTVIAAQAVWLVVSFM